METQSHLQCVLGVKLGDIAPQDVRAPHDRQVLRSHPRPVGLQGHLVEVDHQEVDRPEEEEVGTRPEVCGGRPVVGGGQSVQDLPVLVPPLALAELAGQDEVRVEVVRDEGRGQGAEVELEDGRHAVDVVQHRAVPGEIRDSLLVEQVSEARSEGELRSTGRCETVPGQGHRPRDFPLGLRAVTQFYFFFQIKIVA